MRSPTTIRNPENFQPTGIIDGKHYFFECSNCKAPLVDIWVNYPNDSVWNFIAECCHCGDKSYMQKVEGIFLIGGTEESQKYTAIDDFNIEDDPIIIKTKQVKPYVS